MKMKYYSFCIVLFLINFYNIAEGQSNKYKTLENAIQKQIEIDGLEQDSILFITFLNVNNDPNLGLSNLKYLVDSTKIVYTGGWNFGFYLISKSNNHNCAVLEINTMKENWKSPKNLIKEIRHNSDSISITYFSYLIKEPEEWFNFKLDLEKNSNGMAVAGITIFPKNSKTKK